MAHFNVTQTNFSSGELSPMFKGRIDLEEYANGCELLENFELGGLGGLHRREGIHTTPSFFATGVDDVKLIPFTDPSLSTEYVFRVSLDNASNSLTFDFLRVSTGTAEKSSVFVYTLPIVAADVFRELRWIQVGRLCIFVSGGFIQPIVFDMGGNPAFTFFDSGVSSSILKEPYKDYNTTDTTLKVSHISGAARTLTASKDFFDLSKNNDGRLIRIVTGTTEGVAQILMVTSTTQATVNILVDFANTNASTFWAASEFLNGNYPIDVTFYEGRLIFLMRSGKVICSKRGNIYHLTSLPLLQDTEKNNSSLNFFGATSENNAFPFSFESTTPTAGPATWITANKYLVVATTTTVSAYNGGDADFSINTINNLSMVSTTTSPYVKAELVGDSIVYADNIGQLTMLMPTENGLVPVNISAFNPELLNLPIKNLSYLPSHKMLAIHQEDKGASRLIIMSYQGQKYSFRRVTFGVDDVVFTVCSTYSILGHNGLLFLCKLGVAETYYFGLRYTPVLYSDFKSPRQFLDFGVTLPVMSGEATTSFPEGTNVVVIHDETLLEKTVGANGVVSLQLPDMSLVFIGIPYTSRVKTMPLEVPTEIGTSQGEIKRIHRASIMVYNSKGFKVGSSETRCELDRSPTLFSGRKEVLFPSDPAVDQQIYIEASGLYPCSIVNITAKGRANP